MPASAYYFSWGVWFNSGFRKFQDMPIFGQPQEPFSPCLQDVYVCIYIFLFIYLLYLCIDIHTHTQHASFREDSCEPPQVVANSFEQKKEHMEEQIHCPWLWLVCQPLPRWPNSIAYIIQRVDLRAYPLSSLEMRSGAWGTTYGGFLKWGYPKMHCL